ncbi:hypothetical protein PBAC_12990 [Pedobacter glucosidilyticus]|nr:hypothetical protein [Pedobacter glucosidilyticus]KHJ38504.1 hypothetical protein PBAC_12990 [Pedobacter glucosidilyticus]
MNKLLLQYTLSLRLLIFTGLTVVQCLLLGASSVQAQAVGDVGIGTNTPYQGAALDISSNTKGLLIPRLTTAQRTTLQNSFGTNLLAANGMMIYNTNTSRFNYWNGAQWNDVGVTSTPLNGTQWFVGASIPPGGLAPNLSALGNSGDLYLDGLTGFVYVKQGSSWVPLRVGAANTHVNLKGIKATQAIVAGSVSANSSLKQTYTVVGVLPGGAVSVSPDVELLDGLLIAYARVSAVDTIEIKFINVSGAAIALPANLSIVVTN